MALRKPLNIGLIGYGFMGRTHSNAYKRVNDFFDVDYRPVLKAVCGRDRPGAESFAQTWGYESVETDWRKLVERKDIHAIDICTPNNVHAEIAIAAADAGKMVLCEKPLAMNLGRRPEDGRRCGAGWRPEYGLVQLSQGARRHACQVADRRWQAGQNLSLPGMLPPGLDNLSRSSARRSRALAARCGGGRLGRHRRLARALHRHGPLAQRAHQFRLRHDRDVRERTKA